jgi:hypothetical protein
MTATLPTTTPTPSAPTSESVDELDEARAWVGSTSMPCPFCRANAVVDAGTRTVHRTHATGCPRRRPNERIPAAR